MIISFSDYDMIWLDHLTITLLTPLMRPADLGIKNDTLKSSSSFGLSLSITVAEVEVQCLHLTRENNSISVILGFDMRAIHENY